MISSFVGCNQYLTPYRVVHYGLSHADRVVFQPYNMRSIFFFSVLRTLCVLLSVVGTFFPFLSLPQEAIFNKLTKFQVHNSKKSLGPFARCLR